MQSNTPSFTTYSGLPQFGPPARNGYAQHQSAGLSGPWTPAATTTSRKKKKGSEESHQLKYATEMQKASRFYRRDGVLYRWNGHCFAVVSQDVAETHAFKWLSTHFPDRATPEAAKSCASAAKMIAPDLPLRDPDRIIIPLKDAYLEVKDDTTIVQHEPSKEFGMTFTLDIALKKKAKTYSPNALPPGSHTAKYLATSLPDAEVRDYLQEMAGNTLTPSTKHQVAMVLKGSGSNGKSVFMNVLSALHNPVASMRLDQLTDFSLTPLIGASLVVVDEVPKSGIHEQNLKSCISGDIISINRKHRDPISYRPTAKWVIATNNDQKSLDNSHGFWRRLIFIPFTQELSGPNLIRGLENIIIDNELHLFLDWCLMGLQRLMARTELPQEPSAITRSKREANEASNSVLAWTGDEEAKLHSHAMVEKDVVYKRYRDWCFRQGMHPLSSGPFWKALRPIFPGLKEEQRRNGSGSRPRLVNLKFLSDPCNESEKHPFGD